VLKGYTPPMVFPRALGLRRNAEANSLALTADSAQSVAPNVRESAGLISLFAANLQATISRTTALQVPAFVNAMKTYAHTISAFPLREYRYDTPIAARTFLSCPCSVLPYASVMQRTIEDLLLYDRAYWLVTDRTWDGYPSTIKVMRVEDVTDMQANYTGVDTDAQPPSDFFYYLGSRVPTRDVIKFYGDGNGGWLKNGATALNIAASLEAASLMYAETPIPTVALKNSGADLSADQVDALLEAWEEARATRGTAYLNNSIDAQTMGFSARDVQLVEGKAQSAVAIARLANLDPIWVGAGVPGSSLSYSNRVDLYRQLLDTALRPIMTLVEQRLSMGDITPRGHQIRFDTTLFLRGNPIELADLITKLVPLGVLSIDEAKQVLDLPTLGVYAMSGME
jgi:phage portal protein BeeE